MKKRDEIKLLKHELGRYQKKVGDQSKEISALTKEARRLEVVNGAISRATDMILAQMCLTFGKEEEDADGAKYHVSMPVPREELLGKYHVDADRNEDGEYTVRLFEERPHGE